MISDHIKLFCCEDISKIENYDKAIADKNHIWHCHHRFETFWWFNTSMDALKKAGMYYHRPANELIFLTLEEHSRIHARGNKYTLGWKPSDETRKKMSESAKRRPRVKMSDESKRKISMKNSGKKRTHEQIEKIRSIVRGRKFGEKAKQNMRNAKRGQSFWFNDGQKQIRARNCPDGFVPGRLNNRGTHWFNNGVKEIYCKECPGEDWVRGRI